jgi:hypothetical protein
MQSNPEHLGGACLVLEAVVDLTLDLDRESDATIPTEHGVEDLIEVGANAPAHIARPTPADIRSMGF